MTSEQFFCTKNTPPIMKGGNTYELFSGSE